MDDVRPDKNNQGNNLVEDKVKHQVPQLPTLPRIAGEHEERRENIAETTAYISPAVMIKITLSPY